ncbi:DUF2637 domain-containing protein [Streptomyces sp. NPDC046685]|uniref:DUF2637 domain-containing protein n=1 Tax=Streptomyces sp. NPDC046685 TaxID=3157202 RepID=UPI0033E2E9D1
MPKLLPSLRSAAATPRSEVPPFAWPDMTLLGFAVIGGMAVGGLGLYASLDGVAHAAREWGFTEPWIVPAALDGAIPVFTAAYLILIRMNMPLAWVRFVPWALTVVTCWLNIGVGETLLAKIAHGAMPLLWVVFAEIVAHVYAVRIGVATGRRMEKIRRSRWLLAPVSTFIIWRRMTLWEITSYDVALQREQDRQLVRADFKERYGRRWRRKVPAQEMVLFRLGALAPVMEVETPAVAVGAGGALPPELPPVPPQDQQDENEMLPPPPEPPQEPEDQQEPPSEKPGRDTDREPISEAEMYAIVTAAIKAGEVDRFKTGDLTGSAIGRAMGQTPGNGRKVRHRLLSRYAAETGMELGTEFTVDELMPAASR